MKMVKPKKADFRMHAHVNPLNETIFPYPLNSGYVDWSKHFPAKFHKDPYQLHLNTLENPSSYVDPVPAPFSDPMVDFVDMYIVVYITVVVDLVDSVLHYLSISLIRIHLAWRSGGN